MKKLSLFVALLLGIFLFNSATAHAAVPRVMAYGLKSEMDTPVDGFTKFTFSTNTKPTKAYLIFYHAGEEVYRVDITTQAQKQLMNATYTLRTSNLPELTNMKWAIEVQGDAIGSLECTNDVSGTTTKYKFNRPQGAAIDNNPESDFFGRIYITMPKGGYDHATGIVVFDPIHNVLSNSGIAASGASLDDEVYGMHRIAVNPANNHVYYTKSIASNTAIYELTPDATNILSDGGTAKDVISGLGFTRADAVCFADDGTMFVMDNAKYSGGALGKIYKVKNNAKTLFNGDAIWSNNPNSLASDGEGGIWVTQFRGAAGVFPILAHINASGTADFKVTSNINSWFPESNATKGGSMAYDARHKVVAIGGSGMVMLFQVKEVDGKPTLDSKIGQISLRNNAADEVNGLAFDYAGNIVALSRSSERFYHYAVPTNNNSCITPAKASMQVNGPASSRVLPHDLNVVDNGTSYTFTYKTNSTATSGKLVIFKADGKTVDKTFGLPTPIVKNETCSITVAKSELPKRFDMNWGIELTGKDIPQYSYLQEITDQTREIYDFYNTADVVVDNDPESDHFAKIYVQAARDGASNGSTTRAKNQKAGVFIYNQWLDELNPTSNVGIQPTLPSVYSIGGTDRNKFHRLKIHPTTGDLVYCYAISGSPAVFAMDRDNLTGSATNLLDGVTGITRSVAHCFDKEGNLYVMDLPSEGQIYKIDKDGNKSAFTTALDGKFVNMSISMASDGRGGLWVSQNRAALDTYYQLVHINSSGVIDWSVYNSNDNGFTGGSARGALAYDAERHILAQGRGGQVYLFDVTYNASGVPTLTAKDVTASINGNNIDGIAFDYAGDLYVVNSSKEKFQKFAVPTDNNTCLVPAKKALTVDGEIGNVRVFAYDLESELVTPYYDQYRLSFKSNVAYQSGNIVFMDETGAQVGSKVVITSNPMLINRADLPAEVVNWGVELSAERSTGISQYTSDSDIYGIYNPQGIAIDNSPESDYFGQIYVAAATNGDATKGKTTRTKSQKQGIYVYSPQLAELSPANQGYMPSNVSLSGTDLWQMHRIAVDPITHNVVFVNSVDNTPAIWSVNPADMTGEATNIFGGMSTRTTSLCYDENGVLYVMDATSIYNNDTKTKLVSSANWINAHNAIASDGFGGFWVAQFRNAWDTYQILAHVNKDNAIDFFVNQTASESIKALFPQGYGIAQRGQLAYNAKEQLLAFAGNGQTSLFKVTYDANGKNPSIALVGRTSIPNTANIDGMAFDYAGNLFVGSGVNNGANAGEQRIYAFTVPTANNTCLTPAKKALVLTKEDVNVTVDENNNDITGTVAPYANQPASITLVRALHLNEWNTLTLPFGMDAAQIKEAFGVGTKVAMLTTSRIKSTNSVYIGFSYVNQIEAGKPYLINPTKQVTEDIVPVIINTSTQTISTTILDMIPVLDEETWVANENNFFLGPDAYLYQDAAGGVMPPLRAYFQFHGLTSQQLSNIRARVAFGEDEATDLEDLEVMDEPMSQEEAIKVIENGQLYIIHGGVKYNIQGQVIR